MLIFLAILFFWPFVLWLYSRKLKLAIIIFIIIGLFLCFHKVLLLGEITSTHDNIATLVSGYEYYELSKTTQFLDLLPYLSSWDPYHNCGIPYFPIADLLFNISLLANFYISPMPLNPSSLNNILILNYVIGFSIGMCLISQLIIKNFFVSLFVFVSCLFSNILSTSMIQGHPVVLLCFFAYLFYFVLSWIQNGRPSNFFLAVFLLGLCLIVYIPTLVVYSLGIFLLFYGFIQYGGKRFVNRILAIRPKTWVILVAFCLFCLIISLVGYFYFEFKDYVAGGKGFSSITSPDFEKIKELEDPVRGHPAVIKDFLAFAIDKPFSVANHVWHYAGPFVFYFALLGLLLGFFSDKRKIVLVLFFTSFVLGIISLGYRSPLFPLLNSIPIFNALRHYMYFISLMFFFIIILSAIGFFLWMKAISKASPLWNRLIIVSSIAFGFLYIVFGFLRFLKYGTFYFDTKGITASLSVILIYCFGRVLIHYKRVSVKNIVNISAGVVIITSFLQLVPYQKELLKSAAKPYPLITHEPIKIPTTRNYIFPPSIPRSSPYWLGVNSETLWLLINKEASIFSSKRPFYSGSFPRRTHNLLNVLFPGRNRLEVIFEDFSKTIHAHREPILGYDFPIFFFAPDYEIIPKGCMDDDACLEESLRKMALHYRQDIPDKVYFFEGDVLPPDLPRAHSLRQYDKITPLNIDQDKSTLHEIYGTVNAPYDGFIVRLDNYHRYWRVTVDGKKERIYRGNYAFQAFPVSKGHHNIHFTFESPYPIFFMLNQVAFFIGFIMFLWIGFRYAPEQEVKEDSGGLQIL